MIWGAVFTVCSVLVTTMKTAASFEMGVGPAFTFAEAILLGPFAQLIIGGKLGGKIFCSYRFDFHVSPLRPSFKRIVSPHLHRHRTLDWLWLYNCENACLRVLRQLIRMRQAIQSVTIEQHCFRDLLGVKRGQSKLSRRSDRCGYLSALR